MTDSRVVEWPDWVAVGVVAELHYLGAVRARVTETKSGWCVAFPDGVYTYRKTEAAARACAENNVRCDASLPLPRTAVHPRKKNEK